MNRSFSYEQRVGIDAIAVHVPRLNVDLVGEWATKRAAELGEPSVEALIGKVQKGVGVVEMAIPDAHEDSATLAAMAAVKVVLQAGIDPREIGTIAVGTETTVDQSKSIAAYVLGMLERRFGIDLRESGAPQFQFACIGATYALESTVNMFVSAARTPYRKALQQARDSRHGSNEEQEREARRGRGLASEWNLIGPIRERAGILAFGAGEVGTSRSRGG